MFYKVTKRLCLAKVEVARPRPRGVQVWKIWTSLF